MDPYVILTCRTQEQESSVAKGAGSEPEWNETFIFTISDETPQLNLKIMDSDITNDDFVGEATLTSLGLPVRTSELSASPWRLCFRKAAFLRQFTQLSRRRNTAERSSLHLPLLQQWKLDAPTTRRVLTAAGIDLPDVCTEQEHNLLKNYYCYANPLLLCHELDISM
ncbi:Elicitor-responsive protein 3 [Dichanthelium oligosanthes]|uniref:Elicitor-responsive protein 3 n=1 Tax=Dichanthelium oligosanthes TaxID=888268 RepID=A0A1E5UVE7_9POAL|nr:Elicitor-responsive protein 3 [Dichanthelium oligosanthes]